MKEPSTIEEAGRHARRRNIDIKHCPFRVGSVEAIRWLVGWTDEDGDIEDRQSDDICPRCGSSLKDGLAKLMPGGRCPCDPAFDR